MVTYTKITISGLDVTDSTTASVTKSIGENNASSSFNLTLPNENGYNSNKYGLGDEVIVYADLGSNPPTTRIFTGILEDIKPKGKGYKESIMLSGRDYTARLMDRTVEPEVYTNLPAGSIVRDIIVKYTNDISYSGVQDSATIVPRIAFNQKNVYDSIKQLADLADYNFYVDTSKDLHFEPKSSVSSGYTFYSGNTLSADFKEQRDTIYNQIWVYGDRYLDGYKETFTAGSPLGGSIFSLIYNPHNTEITVNGSIIQPGAIEQMSATPGSNVKYLVNYDNKQITFTSGTSQGNNVPASGASVIVNYKRSLPIVKVGDNETSKAQYGTRVKIIQDKNIKDPLTAEQILASELDRNGEPIVQGTIEVQGVVDITPGQTAIVDFPNQGVDNKVYDIIEADYSLDKKSLLSDNVLTVKVNKKINDVTDTIKDILNQLKKIQSADISDSDVITRLQTSTGSITVAADWTRISQKTVAGDTLIWGNSLYGVWNEYKWNNTGATNMIYDSAQYGKYDIAWYGYKSAGNFVLGNSIVGILGTSLLGAPTDQFRPYITTNYGSYDDGFTGSDFIDTISSTGSLTGGMIIL